MVQLPRVPIERDVRLHVRQRHIDTVGCRGKTSRHVARQFDIDVRIQVVLRTVHALASAVNGRRMHHQSGVQSTLWLEHRSKVQQITGQLGARFEG